MTSKEKVDEAEANDYASNYLSSLKSQYEQSGQDFASALTNYGYADENAFKEAIKKDYIKNQIAKNYISTTIKDDEIEKYYNDEIFGEITAKHILITPETKTNMNDDEKAKAEAKALKE